MLLNDVVKLRFDLLDFFHLPTTTLRMIVEVYQGDILSVNRSLFRKQIEKINNIAKSCITFANRMEDIGNKAWRK